MFVETVEALSTGVGVIEISKELLPTFKRVFNLLKNGDLKIAIFGAGGTGKTTLGKLLSGKFELSSLFQSYQESIATEKYELDSNVVGSVIVVPGQERRENTWDDLLRTLASGKIKLIIHVVSWGYHSFGEISYTNHRLYQSGMSPERFFAEYATNCQDRELNVLKKIEPYLSIANQKLIVMITLVTKQDLWWKDRQQVREHYTNNSYNQVVQKIYTKRGSANFSHEYLSASLVMENLFSGANELLVPTTEGYDQRLKVANFQKLLNTIETLFNISLNSQGG